MTRQRRYASTVAAVSLWLAGCASVGDLAESDPALVRLAEHLDRDDWRIDPEWSPRANAPHRWRLGWHSIEKDQLKTDGTTAIESLVASGEPSGPEGDHPLLALSRRPGRIGRNALILLARSGHPSAASVRERAASLATGDPLEPEPEAGFPFFGLGTAEDQAQLDATDRPTEASRAAAAEAWCHLLASGVEQPEAGLAAPGNAWRRSDLPDLVRGELLRSLARHIAPERIVGYADLFVAGPAAPSLELRRAAMDGCVLFAACHPDRAFSEADWPGAIHGARFDVDAVIRRGYGRWAALARHPDAVTLLTAQLQDADSETRLAAIESLGRLRTDAALSALRTVAARPAETVRAAAAGGLAAWGPAEVTPLMSDESPHVRRAAVAALGRCPSPEAAVLLDAVLADGDLDVQRRAVFATADWPDELALPVLLAGLIEASLRTRRECLEELRRRTGYDEAFPISGPRDEREAALRDAAAKRVWPLDGMTRFRLAAAGPPKTETVASGAATEILTSLLDPGADQEAIIVRLRECDSDDLPAIEAFCLDHPGPAADRLLAEVLPRLSPAHAAAVKLGSDDVTVRRRGAGRLAELGRTATLSPLVLRRIHERLTREQDGLVWRQAMSAIAGDATAGAEPIALLALNNPWPDVRRLGCEYVGRHERPGQANWLLPLLSDDNDAVRLAAIKALGRCGAASGSGTVEALRTASAGSDPTARFAATAALARLGDEQGVAALLRQAEHAAPAERIEAVKAIAATGLRRFEPDLARLIWTERDSLVRRELLLALETLVPPAQRPDGADAPSPEQRIGAWASRKGASPLTMPAPDGGTGPGPAAPGDAPEPPHDSRPPR